MPEVHKLILRLSSKIDRLYELIVQLCRIYDVEVLFDFQHLISDLSICFLKAERKSEVCYEHDLKR